MTRDECRKETERHIAKVRGYLSKAISLLLWSASKHDETKLENPELGIFTEFTPKLAHSTYGSEEYKSFLTEMKVALDHHYKNNRHHPEYFSNGIKGMTLIDLVEMICDWKASTLRHEDGDIMKSIEMNQQRFGYSDELKQIFINTVKQMEMNNDDKTTV